MSAAPRYRVRPRGLPARLVCGGFALLDRVGGAPPAAAAFSRLGLWQRLPRAPRPPADGVKRLALSFDLDYQADSDALPALTDLLGRHDAAATMFSIGKLVDADPAPYRYALAAGHEIANHTWSHPNNRVLNPDQEFWHLDVDAMADEIGRAQQTFQDRLGVTSVGFRTPHFKDAQRMLEALERFPELRYVSSTLAARTPLAQPYFPTRDRSFGDAGLNYSSRDGAESNSRLLMLPLNGCPQHPWTQFCSYHTIRRPTDRAQACGMHDLDDLPALWRRLLDAADADAYACVYFDPLDVMRDEPTRRAFAAMLRLATDRGWRLSRLDRVAEAWRRELLDQPSAL